MEAVMDEDAMKSMFSVWGNAVRRFTNNYIYKAIIFVSNPEDVEYGSQLQKHVCRKMNIPTSFEEEFWDIAGRHALEEAIRRKRNTLTTSMKNRFKEYQKKPWKDQLGQSIPLPDPFEMIPEKMWEGITTLTEGNLNVQVPESIGEEADYEEDLSNQNGTNVQEDSTTLISPAPDNIMDWAQEGLRKKDAYATFMAIFGKSFASGKEGNGDEIRQQDWVSKQLTPTLEAFAVTLYCNNYWKYKEKFPVTTTTQRSVSSISTVSSNTTVGTKKTGGTLFTNDFRGSAKYEGWSEQGYRFFNRINDVVRKQRENTNERKIFEKKVWRLMQAQSAGGKRKRKAAAISCRNDIADLDIIAV